MLRKVKNTFYNPRRSQEVKNKRAGDIDIRGLVPGIDHWKWVKRQPMEKLAARLPTVGEKTFPFWKSKVSLLLKNSIDDEDNFKSSILKTVKHEPKRKQHGSTQRHSSILLKHQTAHQQGKIIQQAYWKICISVSRKTRICLYKFNFAHSRLIWFNVWASREIIL